MATFPAYDVEKIDRLPLQSFYALVHQVTRLRNRRIAEAARGRLIARQRDAGTRIGQLESGSR